MQGVVILSIFDWSYHSHGHSDIQLARAFARRMPVLFVNSIGMRLPRPGTATSPWKRIARKVRSSARLLHYPEAGLNLAVASPLSLPLYSGTPEVIMRWFLRCQIGMFTKFIGLGKPIIIVTVPTFAKVALSLNHESVIYYRSDRHSAFVGVDSEMIRTNEDILFDNASAVLYSNERLFQTERNRLNGRAHLIGHGIDTSMFTPSGPLAPELAHLPRPLVGFFGDLRARSLDFALIAETAALRPDVQFVLGGTQLDDLGELRKLPNIHIVPPCAHEQMPARWRSLDAAILPYQRTAWQEASEPIKLNEIFAVGLPAIGTPLPAFLQRPECVEVADGANAFADALDKTLKASHRDVHAREKVRASRAFTSWETISQMVECLSRSSGVATIMP